MTKHRKPTEAEVMFCCFCDGYMSHVNMTKMGFTVEQREGLHKDATAYVKSVLKLKREQEERDND